MELPELIEKDLIIAKRAGDFYGVYLQDGTFLGSLINNREGFFSFCANGCIIRMGSNELMELSGILDYINIPWSEHFDDAI